MAFNRDLSQLANFLEINSDGTFVNIIPSQSEAQLGIGTNNPTAKLDVLGNARVSGNLSAGNINASSGVITATTFVGALTGLASSATQLATGRTVAITGDLTYTSGVFDGTGNVTGVGTLANTAVTPGSYGSSTEVPTFTVDSKGRITAAGTASVGTALTVAGDSGSENINLLNETLTISGGTNLTSSAASNTVTVNLDPNISLTSVVASGIITATSGFVGNVTGNVTGNINSSGVSTVTSLIATNINASGIVTATSGFVGNLTGNVTGNINSSGVSTVNSLNATNINVSGVTTSTSGFVGNLTGNVTGNINSSGVSTVTSLVATNINASGIVTATSGFVGNVTGNLTGTATTTTNIPNLTGDISSVNTTTTLATVNSNVGSFGSQTLIPVVTVNAKGLVTAVTTAAVGTALTVTGDSGSENIDLLSETLTISGGTNLTSSAASNSVTVNLDPNISLTSVVASGVVTATSGFSGNVTGNLTGNINSSGVSTVTSLNATNINASGIVTAAQFVTGASGSAIGISTNTISGPATITIDPAAVGDNTGLVVIKGDLQIDGTTTTINSTTVTVDDKNIQIADGAANDAAADGAGITITSGDGNKTFQFQESGDNLGSSENLNVASGKVYKVNNTEVLSSNTLGSGVVNSSLTSVGTLTNLSVVNVNSSGIVTATSGFSGNVTGNLTGNINSSGVSTVTSLVATNINASGIVTATSGFVGNLTGLASSATQLQTARDFSISGDATASSVSFNATANVGLALTLANTAVTPGSYGSSTEVPTFTVDSKGRLTAAGTASVGTALTVSGDSGSENIDLLSETLTISGGTNLTSSAASNSVTVNLDPNISLTSVVASGVITATSGFSGNVTGNLSGNINSSGVSTVTSLNATNINASGIVTATNGFVGNVTGNLTGEVNSSSFDTNASGVVVTGVTTSSSGFVGALTGLASSATQLATGRTVAITGDLAYTSGSFDGTSNVTGTGTLATVNSNVGSFGSQTLIPVVTVNAKGLVTSVTTAAVGTALTVSGDSGSENIDLLSETLTISGGTNLTSSAASNTVTVNLDNNISLTSVVASGIITATSGFSGNLTGEVNAAAFDTNASGVVVSGVTTSTSGFVGALTGNVTGNINSSGVSTVTSLNATNINASGIVTATSGFVGNVTGTATSTTNIPNLSGDITSANTVTTLATVNSNVGSFGSQTLIPVVTVNAKGLVTAVTTAAVGTALTVSGDSGSENIDLLSETLTISGGTNLTSSAASNTVTVNLDPNISLTSVVASGVVTATSGFSGNLTGNVSGNVTGNINSSGVSTVTSLNATNINASGIVTATSGFVGNLTGLASSATQLATGRTVAITGDLAYTSESFDGTGNVTGTGTLATVNSNVGSFGSQTLIPVVTVNAKGLVTAVTTAAVGTALTVTGDSGSENISLLSESLTISGGTNLTSSAVSNTVTVNLDPNISLTSVVASGIITAAGGFIGSLNVSDSLTANINSSGVSTFNSLNATNINASGIVTAAQFVTGASGTAIGINTNTISGPATITIDPAAVGDNTGLVVIKGDLQIDGTTTTINSTTVTVDDKNIQIADGAANDAAADGAGITITSGDGNKTFQFQDSGDNLGSSENLNVASGKVYKINNTEVLSSTTLGSGVVNSSLTSVGTLTNLSVVNVNSSGIVTATSGFSGNVTGNVTGNLTGEVNSPSFDTNVSGVVITGVTTSSSGFVGDLTGNITGNLSGNINSSGVSTVTSLIATNINASGIVTATSGFVGNLTGLASSATQLATGRTVAITGDLAYTSESFNGTGNVTGTGTLATVNSNVGSFGSQTLIPVVTVNAKGLVTAVTTAAVGTALTVTGDSGSENIDLLSESLTISGGTNLTSSAASNTLTINLDNNISLTSVVASGIITATSGFVGALTGNVTGNLSGNINSSGVSTVTSLNATNINASGIVTATSGFVGNLTGLASSATQLATGRTITITGDLAYTSGVFDGTGNVTGTSTLAPVNSNVGSFGSQTLIPVVTVNAKGLVTAVTTAAVGTALTVTGDSGSENIDLLTESLTISGGTNLTSSAASNTVTVNLDPNISLTSVVASGVITATSGFSGNVTGNLTGEVNAPSFDTNASGVVVTGVATATTFVGALTGNVTGNVTGNINSSGVSTVTNLNIDGYVSIGNTTGVMNQVLASVGAGVTWKNFNDILPQTRTTQTFTATANQTVFNFVYNVNFLDVFVNGVKLSSGEFTASNGTSITLSEAAFANDTVEFVSYATLGAGTGQVSSLNDLTDVTLSGIATGNLLAYNGSEFVNTSTLSNITALDATTTATIETAIAASPNNFTSLNISGVSTFQGGAVVGSATTFTEDLVVQGDARVTGILTVGTASITLNGENTVINVGAATTIHTTGFAIGNSFLHSTGLSLSNINASGIITAAQFVGDGSGLTGAGSTVFNNTTTNQEFFPLFTSTTSGTITASGISTSKLKYNPSTGTVTATSFVGALTGTASTTTNIPNLTGAITSNNTTTSLGSFSSSNLATALTDETGSGAAVFATSPTLVTPALGTPSSGTLTNCTSLPISGLTASTSTALGVGSIELGHASDTSITRVSAGLVAIEGVNIVTTSSTDTLTNKTLTSPTLTTPVLGTPQSGTLTSCTGLPVSTGISGLAANVATFLATPSSANLISAVTDETGSGALVFATSPTLVTPVLGAATATSVVVGSGVTINASGINASGIVTASQLSTGASGTGINITTNTISGPATLTIDPAAVGDNTGAVRIKGDLYVDGTQFIVNSTTIELADFVVGIASTATTDTLADGAGIKIGPDNTLTYDHTNTSLKSSENFNVASGKTYKINGTDVLSATTLGSAVVNSSLTSVGTLTNLNVGNVNSTGIITATTIELGHATDTTLARSAAGVVTIEGVEVVTLSRTQTLTNKTLTSPTLTTPVLGTPSSGTLTSCTGLPISTGVSGLAANVATFLATPSSANLISAVTDETGSGALVFATSPTLVTPALGTPASGTLTSCTGLPITGITSSTTIGLGVGSIELGHASDTSITRVSAGVVAIEGVNVVTVSATQTLTNKTLTSPTLTTPALGTPSSGTLTSCTGLPLTTGVTGTLPVANGGTGVTASTGTGSVVLSASPTFTGTVGAAAITATGDIAAANFNSTSDINLKENIKQVESASELVSKLEGVHFSWKETGKETIGVIAQQIEEHLPQLVQTGDTHKTVNYNGLIGVLIEAVKEQGAQIAALQAEIEELKK